MSNMVENAKKEADYALSEVEEKNFLNAKEDYFGIYQLKKDQRFDMVKYMPCDFMEKHGVEAIKSNYILIYVGKLTEGLSLDDIFFIFNADRPEDFHGHSLSVSDVVVLHENGRNLAYYVEPVGFLGIDYFLEPDNIAYEVENRFIGIQICDDGYDYSIYDENYTLLDGGIYDNPDVCFRIATFDIIDNMLEDEKLCGSVSRESCFMRIDYEKLMERVEVTEQKAIERHLHMDALEKYKSEVEARFHTINGMDANCVLMLAKDYLQEKITAYDLDAQIVDAIIAGSRGRGEETAESDLDIVVEFQGSIREDFLFNVAHEDEFLIGDVLLDINPIKKEKSGTLKDYIEKMR